VFTNTFDSTPRLYLLIYGQGKIGKTRAVLDAVETHGHYMVMLSTDKGLIYVSQNPEPFNKKLAVAEPRTLEQMRKALKLGEKKVSNLIKQGVPEHKIWFVIDNATHLQQRLMNEARKVFIGSGRGNVQKSNEYEREMTTDMDYQVNLGHMTEIADVLDSIPCNVVVIALEKDEYDKKRETTGRKLPQIGGQPAVRFIGDADAVLHLRRDKKGVAYFQIHDSGAGGDRSGKLDKTEPADVVYVVNKMRARVQLKLPADAEPIVNDELVVDEPAPNPTVAEEATPDSAQTTSA
jgi:hypothetical protein